MVIQTAARHADREGREKMIELGSQRDTRQAPESAVLDGSGEPWAVGVMRSWSGSGWQRRHMCCGTTASMSG